MIRGREKEVVLSFVDKEGTKGGDTESDNDERKGKKN